MPEGKFNGYMAKSVSSLHKRNLIKGIEEILYCLSHKVFILMLY